MTIPADPNQESRRRLLRGVFVAALAGFAIATSLPNLYYAAFPMYGTFGVVPDENNVVIYTDPSAKAAGVRIGDRVVFSAMPLNDRYVERFPPIGRTVTFVLERAGVRHALTLTAKYYRERWAWALWSGVAKKTVSLLLITIGSALFFLRPTRLSRAFFLYTLGGANSVPYLFCLLPILP
jgi:hypothetical protein